jgi:nucleotide-binding universal stress UspA family protein
MTRPDPHPLVIVGYDGSAAARAAVRRGIERVGSTGHLIVVHSHSVPPDYIGVPYYQEVLDRSVEDAENLMDELEETLPALHSVDYERDVVTGEPAEVISRVAHHRHADEIILGSRGVGRVRAVMGSVAHDVLHRAHCPVTVIPARMIDEHDLRAA